MTIFHEKCRDIFINTFSCSRTLMDTINITSQLIRRLRMVVKKIDIWLLQLPVLLIAIGSLNPAADFTSSDWICGTFYVIFMVFVSVHDNPV
jgi:hypothetical protein